jgi:NADH-quinone oxidoreductase subunit E
MIFTPELKAQCDELVSHYPVSQAAVIPVLHLVQQKEGLLTKAAQAEVADYLKIPLSKVEEVVSFYTMFTEKPRGKHHLMVCRTLSCALGGCQDVMKAVESKLGVGPNQVTSDGKFSWEKAECLAACDLGSVIQVGDKYHGKMDAAKALKLLDELKDK